MAPAYEALLADQLARLDRWIAESEPLALQTSDEDTRNRVEADLARWRHVREQNERTLRRTKVLNRCASWAIAVFWITFACLCGLTPFVLENDILLGLIAAGGVLLLIGSAVTYLVALGVRDAVAQGRRPWHFSVRGLLIITTGVALLLGLWFYATRY